MSRLALFRAVHDEARKGAAAMCFSCPDGTIITFADPVKSREQEEKYHALIGEIAANPPPDALRLLNGQALGAEAWKRLLLDAFKHDTFTDPDLRQEWDSFGAIQLLPALNHPGFVMAGEQSRRFSKKLATAFITWLQAFQAGA